jgi:3-oxoacyl-[acyl-carrier protein] reductase
MVREGAKVIVMDRPEEDGPASKLAAELGAGLLLCDITDPEAPEAIKKLLAEKYQGTIDILVHNAGVTRDKMLVNMDEKRWDMTLEVNLIALIRITEALESAMNDDGRVVCLSSVTGIAGNTGQTNYSASKAGILGYIGALAPAYAKRGIAVNAVAPGFIETRMTAHMPVATREVARRLCNLSQGGRPEDVAEVVTFLSSPGAAGLTGEVIRICGGSLLGA